MAKHPNTFRETTEPSETPKRVPLTAVPGPGTDAVAKEVGAIHNAITHDANVSQEGVKQLDSALIKLTIDVGGVAMTVEEAAKNPELKENARIWQEILSGNYKNLWSLTLLPALVAERLITYDGQQLHLGHLTSLSVKTAEHISKYKGYISLSDLPALSDTAAEHLGKHIGQLVLNGLTSLSDIAAEHLSKLQGWLMLGGLTSISDTAAKHLGKHKDLLDLSGLTTLSDTAAEHLGKHKGILDLTRLTSLSDIAAKHLARHRGELRLFFLSNLSDIAAKYLASHRGKLVLGSEIQQKVDFYKTRK